MKLKEMFDKEKAISDFEKEKKENISNADTETSVADMIISQFEVGKISYSQAKTKLIDNKLGAWIQELNMADELQKERKKAH